MFRALLSTTAAAAVLLAGGHWTPVHAQPAVLVVVDNPWSMVTKETLPLAIAAAEKLGGGRVLEIRFRVRNGVPGFDAVVAQNGAFSHLRFDIPSNVTAVIAEAEVPAWMAGWVLKADAKSLQKAKLRLVDAVLKAEEMTDAPAVDAGIAAPLSGGNSVLAYNIEVIRGNRPERVVIDAVTGLRIADPQPLLEGWTPEQAIEDSLKKAAPPR
ncbi:MAG: hypothetical protein JWQ46_1314 [Phenylobacterium sp.]|jgi:hypothetical protein|nr:hypothetical protein [Phenylobacterium sp.]